MPYPGYSLTTKGGYGKPYPYGVQRVRVQEAQQRFVTAGLKPRPSWIAEERSVPGKGTSRGAVKCGQTLWKRPPASRGFTLVELIATMAIMLILAGMALPIARVHAQRVRETELHRNLREVRDAIDRYKDFSDRGMMPVEANTFGYPPDLDTLVSGVTLKGAATAKYKFLRRIPVDPMTDKAAWGLRSMQDDPDSKSWGGEDVFDVYSLSQGTALDGTNYSDW